MTIQAIRENLEHARDEGLPTSNDDGNPIHRRAGLHETKLYSICEGLIVEIERLQEQLAAHEADKSAGVHRLTRTPHATWCEP